MTMLPPSRIVLHSDTFCAIATKENRKGSGVKHKGFASSITHFTWICFSVYYPRVQQGPKNRKKTGKTTMEVISQPFPHRVEALKQLGQLDSKLSRRFNGRVREEPK